MLDRIVRFFTSLRLTVTLLGLGVVVIFLGTLAQEPLGLYQVQARFFQSLFVDATAFYAGLHKFMDMVLQGFGYPLAPLDPLALRARSPIPVFPGGYLLGGLLLINLFAAHLRYYKPGQRKIGVALIHLGVVLLLLGQLFTDLFSNESVMGLRNGETKNYSESQGKFELAIIDTTDAKSDLVVAIPESFLKVDGTIPQTNFPFKVSTKTYYPNSDISEQPREGFETINTTAGFGKGISWRKLPHETEMEKRDMPSGIVEINTPQGLLGTFLVSSYVTRPQEFTYNDRTYEMTLRPERFYKPFSIKLIEFRHDKYAGTETPMNFSSRVRLQRPETKEDREVLIYMNNPLRYGGETFYQHSFFPDDGGTVLQVVKNPSSFGPYAGCWVVALGLMIQFLSHFFDFAKMGLSSKLSETERQARAKESVGPGIQGWLLVSGLALLLMALGWLGIHGKHLFEASRNMVADQRGHLLWQWLVVLVFWGYMLFVVWQFFTKRRALVLNLIFLIVALPIVWVVMGALGDMALGDRALSLNTYVGATGQGLISIIAFFVSAFWILYLMRSRRVAATFLK